MGDRLLTVAQAASLLGTTEKGLRWMIHKKTAPRSAKISGRRMFRESDLEQFIDEAFAKEAS